MLMMHRGTGASFGTLTAELGRQIIADVGSLPQRVTFDLLPTSVLFRPGDKIRITIAAADPDNFQLLPATGNAAYRISSTLADPSLLELPIVG
jgi:hypothetical protein